MSDQIILLVLLAGIASYFATNVIRGLRTHEVDWIFTYTSEGPIERRFTPREFWAAMMWSGLWMVFCSAMAAWVLVDLLTGAG